MLQHRTCLQDQAGPKEWSEVDQGAGDQLMDKAQDTEDVASSVMVLEAADVRDFQKRLWAPPGYQGDVTYQ